MARNTRKPYRAPQLDFTVDVGHIALAIPKDSSHCMIADALRSAIPGAEYVSVDLATIRFSDPIAGLRYVYLTPATAQLALLAFDRGDPVKPFHVRANAAQVLHSGAARKARHAQAIASGEERAPREQARIQHGDAANGLPGIKVGGKAPPAAPLYSGSGSNGQIHRGKRRQYGLRALIQ